MDCKYKGLIGAFLSAVLLLPSMSWGHTINGVNVTVFNNSGYASRISGLGANATNVSSTSAVISSLGTADVIYLGCCGYDDDFSAAQVTAIQNFVANGGGLIVGQPNRTGAVGLLPTGFEVTVSNINHLNASSLQITATGSSHAITAELTGTDISGNYETVLDTDIGANWDILVRGTGAQSNRVALLAGLFGNGRLVFETGNLTGSDPGSDHYVENLIAFAAAPVPEPSTVVLMLAGLAGLGFMRRRSRRA